MQKFGPTEIHRQVIKLQNNECERVILKMPSGWAILGTPQVTHGYALLLPDPVVPHLNALSSDKRSIFLRDMCLLGDALLKITGCVRINYEMLGNLEPALHAHVIPRYEDEPEHLKTKPIWSYNWAEAHTFSPNLHQPLIEQIKKEIRESLRSL